MDKDKLWQQALGQLQIELTRSNYSLWFGKTFIKSLQKINDRQLVEVACQSSYAKNRLENQYLGQVSQILDKLTGVKNEVRFVVFAPALKLEEKPGPLFSYDDASEKKELFQSALARARLNSDFTFSNFAVASTNEMAYAAATTVAKQPGKSYNPLFLYGGVGVGKTHLMQAIGISVLTKNPLASILYVTSEEFMNEIIIAIRSKNTQNFKRKYRGVKLLLIDDIQFIAGKDTVQEEFFHTFNALKLTAGQMVMTSDRLPEQIDNLEDRLRSRFEGGLTIDIQEPNFELRTAILLIKAKQMGENLPIEAAKLISQKITSTRKLEGMLVRIISEKGYNRKELDLELVKKILEKTTGEIKLSKTKVTPDRIIRTVADFYQIRLPQIKGARRLKHIVLPRQMAIYILRSELGLPFAEIGRIFGGKDHTTIMHSNEKIKLLADSSAQIKEELANIRKRLV